MSPDGSLSAVRGLLDGVEQYQNQGVQGVDYQPLTASSTVDGIESWLREPVNRVTRRGRCGSFTREVADGAYGPVIAWRSSTTWLSTLRRVLQSDRGQAQLQLEHLVIDTFLMVARKEAASADYETGRGVTTAHQTLAKRAGVSVSTVRRVRRVLETLGFSVTLQVGRYLTRAERVAAHRVHGGRQVRMASTRALTLPSPAQLPVDHEHLPSDRKVSRSSHSPAGSPTRAGARAKAAPRPSRERKTRARRSDRPRPVTLQRFTWQVAERFGLLESVLASRRAPVRVVQGHAGGSLTGGRHIGALSGILQRYDVVPGRYTVDSLGTELAEMARDLHLTPLTGDQTRDKLAYFAHTLSRLAQHRPDQTLLERRNEANAARAAERAARQRATAEAARRREATRKEDDQAAQAFFDSLRRRPRRAAEETTVAAQRRLVRALLEATPLHAATVAVQEQIGRITECHKALAADGWRLTTAEGGCLVWESATGEVAELTIVGMTASTPGNVVANPSFPPLLLACMHE